MTKKYIKEIIGKWLSENVTTSIEVSRGKDSINISSGSIEVYFDYERVKEIKHCAEILMIWWGKNMYVRCDGNNDYCTIHIRP